jgi:DNA-binding CsgD family transcriptional regulator
VSRARGLVASAQGDIARAISLLERAVAELEGVGDPFGAGRARLSLGIARRRARQKAGARHDIIAAVETFEAVGARLWAQRARAELGRIGGRTRLPGLTPAETRVVDLVVQGRTNREIASMLFLGERTVATHLTHVYAKLGVRSRTELAGRLRAAPPP